MHLIARESSSIANLDSLGRGIVVHVHDGSMRSMQSIIREAQPEIVFHLASLFLSEHEPEDVPRLISSNILFGTQLVDTITRQETRLFINTGTSWQHYEQNSYSPVCLYAATKQAFEDLLQYYVEAHDLDVITLKLFDTYGKNDPRPKLINVLKKASVTDESLIMSPGEQMLDLVHVDDVIEAFQIAADRLRAGKASGHERYAVSSGQPIRLRDLVHLIEELSGNKLSIVWGGRSYRTREVMTPWATGKTLPGWKPRIGLRDGLAAIFRS